VEREQDHIGEVIGALIVEQIETDLPHNVTEPRLDLVYEHSARALANATDHSNLFLMPLWRALGRATWVVKGKTLPKTLTIAALVLIAAGVLTFVKKDFTLKANGALQPVVKQDVFVDVGGTVTEVHVADQEPVNQGDPLVTLRNTDLEVQLEKVVGELAATHKQLSSVRYAPLTGRTGLSDEEKIRLSGQEAELTKQTESLEKQKKLLEDKRKRLVIHSPISGRVMLSWDVERSLKNRTVEVGQILMSVADPNDDWELELFMPERRMGHVDRARQEQKTEDPKGDLKVTYILATDPNTPRTGWVKHVEEIAQVHQDEGNTVRIRVSTEKSDITDPRPGASVTARVLCGRRAIGYAWFHEALEWLQANVLF